MGKPTTRPRSLLLIASRAPVPGQTKTRLGATIGIERAAALHRAFLADLAHHLTPRRGDAAPYHLGWAFTPADCDFRAVITGVADGIDLDGVLFVAQDGDGWDVRQANLLRWGHDQGYERTILLGSDSPHIPRATIEAAVAALDDHDLALGRVLDGGYYLIGLRGFVDVLTGVPMSTTTAAEALLARAASQRLRVAELPITFDVDVEADLAHLIAALAPDGAAAPATWRALGDLGLLSVPASSGAEQDPSRIPG